MERDKLRKELRDLANARSYLVAEKDKNAATFKEQIADLEKSLRAKEVELETKCTDYLKLDRMFRMATEEREKMRQRLVKLKMKKVTNPNQKLCKNCGREYLETDNYNWSCRTHRVPTAIHYHRANMADKCGGAVEKPTKKHLAASMPNTSARKTKTNLKNSTTLMIPTSQKRRNSSVRYYPSCHIHRRASLPDIRARTVLRIQTCTRVTTRGKRSNG